MNDTDTLFGGTYSAFQAFDPMIAVMMVEQLAESDFSQPAVDRILVAAWDAAMKSAPLHHSGDPLPESILLLHTRVIRLVLPALQRVHAEGMRTK